MDHSIAKVGKEHSDREQSTGAENAALKNPIDHSVLLKFTHPVHLGILLDSSMRQSWIDISACLSGKFYVPRPSHQTWRSAALSPSTDADVVCYHRNIFRVAGSVTMPLGKCHVRTSDGSLIPIIAQSLIVSAIENLEGKSVKILLAPPQKGSAGGTSCGREGNVGNKQLPSSLAVMKNQHVRNKSSGMVKYTFVWEQLQFHHATQENTVPGNWQETFTVRVQVIATLSTGAEVPVSEVLSSPIIVCGWNPNVYQPKRDLPLDDDTI